MSKASPSALIPFCEFGGNMSSVGVNIEQFDVPVCNSFQEKILNDQLCYEVDLSRFSDKYNIDKEIKLGFNFIMDYNEDRQIERNFSKNNNFGLASNIVEFDQNRHAFIYIDTIGKHIILNDQKYF